MACRIAVQAMGMTGTGPRDESLTSISLLPGAIEGVETNYYIQGEGTERSLTRNPRRGQVLFFSSGAGEVRAADQVFEFSEVAAFLPPVNTPVLIRATSSALECLEILMDFQDHEIALLPPRGPYFILYSQCEPYSEAIKSPRTVSRTIVPANTIPRFCMGSVETVGPDEVAPHAHPMLEQLFFGLPGNACVVTADDAEAALGERALLHIPLGSQHGVRVAEGNRMHYIWMDFFRHEEDLAYIQEQHKPIKR